MKAAISGSYSKFYEEVQRDIQQFKDCGAEVLSPKGGIIASHIEGFVALQNDLIRRIDKVPESMLSQAMRVIENSHLRAIRESDLLWLVTRNGYFGISSAFEIGWALAHNVPVYYSAKEQKNIEEPIIRCYASPAKSIEYLVNNFDSFSSRKVNPEISGILLNRFSGASAGYDGVAVGGVVVDSSGKILVVKTGTWGEQYTLVGGRLNSRESLDNSLRNSVKEQIGVECEIGELVCAFREIPDSGFYVSNSSRIFIDNIVKIKERIRLSSRLRGYELRHPKDMLKLDIEPNARKTLITCIDKVACYEQTSI